MDIITLLQKRKATRAYKNTPVEKEKIITILEAAKWAPSGVNMQPFDVHVVSGLTKQNIENEMLLAFEDGKKEVMDYQYYPTQWIEPYKSRRKETGLGLYSLLQISREDTQRQKEQWKANYKAFGAPTVLYFCLDRVLEKGSYLDYGMFLQSVMLVATHLGLASCPMASLAEYPSIVKKHLDIPQDKVLVCGIALGYEDTDALINSFKPQRIALEEFVKFYE